MLAVDQTKIEYSVFPQAIVDNTAPAGAWQNSSPTSVDRSGFDHARLVVTVGATDIALTKLAVRSGASVASGASDSDFTEITGSEPSTLPSATDDNKLFYVDLDLRAMTDRYIIPDIVVGNGSTGAFVTAFFILSRGDTHDGTAASQGAESITRVVVSGPTS